MLKAGITGGIGSGKTTCCKIFECLGVPVFYADLEAKKLMNENQAIRARIKSIFGRNAYDEKELLNRKFIANKVFGNQKLLSKLNGIVHPAVYQAAEKWFTFHQDKTYTLYEAALIFETGSMDRFDKIITVIAPKKLRIRRVALRDHVTQVSVAKRMEHQMSQWEKLRLSDYQIRNNGKLMLLPQINKIHQDIMYKSRKNNWASL